MKKVCIFLANGFEEVEALTVVDLLKRASLDVVMVSIQDELQVTGAHKIQVVADSLFEKIEYKDVDMLILPGGMPGTNHLANHDKLINLLIEHNNKQKWIAAICAAPSVLGMNGILSGRAASCYPGFEDKLVGADVKIDNVVVSENIITSRGLGTAIEFGLKIIEILVNKSKANEIKEAIIYKNN
ncbi:DJ-1 family glyoxalase III [Anaeromicropila herbilytica]|uniref:Thiazole biosynthesis protein ThiJ n=1 Tax=Anaeromicropila herbilytica TaxID=2785025 RepID=A0A7R7ID54_9FIRM|nr:DJ-1 family glyoxalase III [Anaeromicropila herbilytica]BCN29678.1 thiazole biosynthesis protein ThiJ [Anaeromicropila herbilytica]